MRVLVTGAQGFIGRYLCAALACEPWVTEILGVGRSDQSGFFTHGIHWHGALVPAPVPSELELPGETYRYMPIDLVDQQALESLLDTEHPDYIVHLAGSLRDESIEHLLQNNVLVTHNVCIALGRMKSRPKLVIASTGSVYGSLGGDGRLLTETGPTMPVDPYAVSKRAAEDLAGVYAREHELDVRIARIFAVLGAGQEERHLAGHLAAQIARDLVEDRDCRVRVGNLQTCRDFIDVKDVVSALVSIMRKGASGKTYNVASGRETLAQGILDGLAMAAGRPVKVIPRTWRKLDFARQRVDVSHLEGLGWFCTTSIETSVQSVLDYYLGPVRSHYG